MAKTSVNLISNTTRVECPFIKITIGQYTFGVYDKVTSNGIDNRGVYAINRIKYPNYVQSLRIEKINGTVNKYTLKLSYPITEGDDPNFFYKVFSSVSQTRKIIFSYGDLSAPTFCFREEEAFLLSVKEDLPSNSSVIDYTVSAISNGKILTNGAFDFTSSEFAGKHKVFYGMNDKQLVEQAGLIPGYDVKVDIEPKTNISSIDYLLYLVSIMKNVNSSSLIGNSVYTLVVMDDTSGVFKGPYFKIIEVANVKDMPLAYEIDYGYPSPNVVTNFKIEDDEGYTIFYNFFEKLNDDQYVQRINDRGELVEVYAPILGSDNAYRKATEAEKTWWTTVTQFPIKGSITIKGLLRPALLMSHVRINARYFGRQHVSSGLYIVTKQVDQIDASGYRTTLSLLRIGKASDLDNV